MRRPSWASPFAPYATSSTNTPIRARRSPRPSRAWRPPTARRADPVRADRRTLLIGAGALTLGGMALGACARATEPATAEPVVLDLDLSALEARHGGRLGVSVLTEGKRADWRGDERFVYCSTFKMYLAAATLLRVQAGQERLDRAIPV